jgi:hypothetical protein
LFSGLLIWILGGKGGFGPKARSANTEVARAIDIIKKRRRVSIDLQIIAMTPGGLDSPVALLS